MSLTFIFIKSKYFEFYFIFRHFRKQGIILLPHILRDITLIICFVINFQFCHKIKKKVNQIIIFKVDK